VQKYKRVLNFTIVLLFLAVFWIIVAFINFTTENNTASNKSLLPENIDLVIRANTKEIIQTFLVDLLFKANLDKESAQLFIPEESQEIKKLGTDITTEVVVFYDNWNNSSAKGVLLNISNEGDFKRYQIEGENTIKVSNSEYGVLIYLADDATSETVAHYTQLAEKTINKEKQIAAKEYKKGLINLTYQGDELSYLKDLELDLNVKNQTIFINGKGKLNKKSKSKTSRLNVLSDQTSKKHLEIQTSELPKETMDYLSSFINEIGIKIPSISSQQMMIYGITVDNLNGSTAILPNFDWIVRFDKPFQIDSVLSGLQSNYKSMVDLNNKIIEVGSIKYHYNQLSENEIFVGISEKPSIKNIENKPAYIMRGIPTALLEIQGESFIAGFIQMLPQVRLSKQFFEDVTYFDIQATTEKDLMNIEGEIRLKDDQLMSVELAKYVFMFLK
jgi:hypothetical protein